MPTAQLGQGQREVDDFGLDPGLIFGIGPPCQLGFEHSALLLYARDNRLHLAPALRPRLGDPLSRERRAPHTMKLSPQPQAPLAFGFSNTKPAVKSSSRQSMTLPMR